MPSTSAPATGAPRVLVVQHEDACPPALLGGWLEDAGLVLDVRRPYAGEALPDHLDDHDALLVLGGSMGADDDADHAWLAPLKALIARAAHTRVPQLGVCLGHQLMASALGGRVARNPLGQQLGLLDVGWLDAASSDPLLGAVATPRRGVQWNNDLVVDLPAGAVVLARTARGEVQAVRHAPRAWGVQLHPEADLAVVTAWARHDEGSHRAAGVDQVALLAAVDDARAELDAAWQPLAVAFAALVTGPVTGSGTGPTP